MALETNVRVVWPGPDLYLNVRRMIASGQNLDRDLLERVCSRLRLRYGLAAIPEPGEEDSLLVVSARPVPSVQLQDDDWEIQAEDMSRNTFKIHALESPDISATLIERALQASVARRSGLWSFNSPKLWYQETPFKEAGGISAFRRYEISATAIEDVGIGVVADIGTTFFSKYALDYYFAPDVNEPESARRVKLFDALSGRKEGQKGTLVYDYGKGRSTCYFEEAPDGLTCGNTGRLSVRGRSYESLYQYYREIYPGLEIPKDAQAVRVSFPGLSRPQPVAAHLLKLRIMNNNLPRALSSVDKIGPGERHVLLHGFWESLGERPLGRVAPGLIPGFWKPPEEKIHRFEPPPVEFGDSKTIRVPNRHDVNAHRKYYKDRMPLLKGSRCHSFPPASTRTIYVAHPRHLEKAAGQAADDVANRLNSWTKRRFQSDLVGYDTVIEACDQLRDVEEGLVLFVLNDEPAAYYEASFNLPGWRVKRIRESTLMEQMENLESGVWDRNRGPEVAQLASEDGTVS